ncbi:hypothetical protein Ndes2437B_g00966 [Nannochloris sp. 'desiccata']
MTPPSPLAFAFCALLFIVSCISSSTALNLFKSSSVDSLAAQDNEFTTGPDPTSNVLPPRLRALLDIDDDVDQQRKAKKKSPPPPKRRPPGGSQSKKRPPPRGSSSKKRPPPRRSPPKRSPPPRRSPPKRSPPPPRKSTRPPPRSPKPIPSPFPSPIPTPIPTPDPSPNNFACSITIDSVTTNFKTCIEMKDTSNRPIGTAGFSFSSTSQNELVIGFKAVSTTPGWVALGYTPNGRMIGTDAVFAQSCGGTCVEGYSKTLNGYVFQAFGPSKVNFSGIKAGKDENGFLIGTSKMDWPGSKDSIAITMASGPLGGGIPQIHFGVPQVVTLKKSDLK